MMMMLIIIFFRSSTSINLNCFFSVKDEKIKAIVLYNRGTIRYRMGCFSDALGDLEIASKSEPDNEEFKEALMKCKNESQK